MKTKKIALIGATGIVGEAILEVILQECNDSVEMVAFSNNPLKIEFPNLKKSHVISLTNFKQLRKMILDEKPNFIINAVGISDREYCENNKQTAWLVNVQLVEHLVSLSKILDATLITFSCEDVFDGRSGPYSETDKPNPQNYLGKTKLAAENFVQTNIKNYAIVRLPLVYGVNANGKKDFVAKVIDNSKKERVLKLFLNYLTNPVLSEDVAWGVMKIVERELTGIFHFGGFDYVSLDGFAKKILKFFGLEPNIMMVKPPHFFSNFGLRQTYSEALLSIKFSSISEGLITYKYLDREEGTEFEKLMNF